MSLPEVEGYVMSAQSEPGLSTLAFCIWQLAAESPALAERLGYAPEHVKKLGDYKPADVRELSSRFGMHFLSVVRIDSEQLGRMLARFEQAREEETLVDKLLKHGAPLDMMATLFGMNGHEFAERRKALGLASTVGGRPRKLSEAEEHRVYEMFSGRTMQ